MRANSRATRASKCFRKAACFFWLRCISCRCRRVSFFISMSSSRCLVSARRPLKRRASPGALTTPHALLRWSGHSSSPKPGRLHWSFCCVLTRFCDGAFLLVVHGSFQSWCCPLFGCGGGRRESLRVRRYLRRQGGFKRRVRLGVCAARVFDAAPYGISGPILSG